MKKFDTQAPLILCRGRWLHTVSHTSLPGAMPSRRIFFPVFFSSGRCNEKMFSLPRLAEFEQLASLKLPKCPLSSPPIYDLRVCVVKTSQAHVYHLSGTPCHSCLKDCLTSAEWLSLLNLLRSCWRCIGDGGGGVCVEGEAARGGIGIYVDAN